MDMAEAQRRVHECGHRPLRYEKGGGHFPVEKRITPKITADGLVCEYCGVGIVEDSSNTSGYRHYHSPGPEKACAECGEVQPVENFYTRRGKLDGLYASCRTCAQRRARQTRRARHQTERGGTYSLPISLYRAMLKVKGNQTIVQFIEQSVRAEVERRARHILAKQTLEGIRRGRAA